MGMRLNELPKGRGSCDQIKLLFEGQAIARTQKDSHPYQPGDGQELSMIGQRAIGADRPELVGTVEIQRLMFTGFTSFKKMNAEVRVSFAGGLPNHGIFDCRNDWLYQRDFPLPPGITASDDRTTSSSAEGVGTIGSREPGRSQATGTPAGLLDFIPVKVQQVVLALQDLTGLQRGRLVAMHSLVRGSWLLANQLDRDRWARRTVLVLYDGGTLRTASA